jgi:hypothetical protein
MLCAVMSSPGRAVAGLMAAAALVVAGCTSTTDGSGTPAPSASSSHDFPSGSAPGPTGGSIGGSSAAAPSSGSGSLSSSTHPIPSTPRKTVTVHAASGTNYLVKIWADVKDASCFDHAYGKPMVAFLIKHPCQGLERYLGTTTVNGNPVGFAESVTGFPGTAKDPYANSNEFIKLENSDGTGSISDLLREGYRLPAGPSSVPASEAFRVISQDNGVTVWDMWYLADTTPPNDPALNQMAQDIFLQF